MLRPCRALDTGLNLQYPLEEDMVAYPTVTWPGPQIAWAQQVFKQVCRMQALFSVSM